MRYLGTIFTETEEFNLVDGRVTAVRDRISGEWLTRHPALYQAVSEEMLVVQFTGRGSSAARIRLTFSGNESFISGPVTYALYTPADEPRVVAQPKRAAGAAC